jgi:hypothetical protein
MLVAVTKPGNLRLVYQIGLHPRRQRSAHPLKTCHPGPVDGGVADHFASVQQTGKAGLAGQLEIEEGGVLNRDRRSHLREHVTRSPPLAIGSQTGTNAAVDQLLDRGGTEATGHLAGRSQGNGGPGGGDGIEIGVAKLGAVDQGDILSEPAMAAQIRNHAAVGRFDVGVDA